MERIKHHNHLSNTILHVFHGGTVTGVRYRDKIFDPCVKSYAGVIGKEFTLMDEIAQPQRARLLQEYLQGQAIQRMDWQA
ncbi:hypothetical protein AVEN_149111-1 [Araneus ventricosus]|uniref:Uncharacterized protein n=1 Tax=Araneus ventricosus TaxID=182803 RepID=A0A4Y2WCE5_ARAVE|nr:hypothetical protein AVEN_149111-1 [Araneus ventricosus]